MSKKKAEQLGMNPSTASGRLVKDLLWMMIEETGRTACFQCGEEMTRDTFSVEHKIPWLDSEDPVGLYFDLSNVSFSHRSCNIRAARKPQAVHGSPRKYQAGCRCDQCVEAKARYRREYGKGKPCGTIDRYLSGCRCSPCTEANRAKHRS